MPTLGVGSPDLSSLLTSLSSCERERAALRSSSARLSALLSSKDHEIASLRASLAALQAKVNSADQRWRSELESRGGFVDEEEGKIYSKEEVRLMHRIAQLEQENIRLRQTLEREELKRNAEIKQGDMPAGKEQEEDQLLMQMHGRAVVEGLEGRVEVYKKRMEMMQGENDMLRKELQLLCESDISIAKRQTTGTRH